MSFSVITKEELKKSIESHFYEDLRCDDYEVEIIDAKNLLTFNRFDLSFKLIFLKMIDYDLKFAHEIYEEHIRALSLGKFKEPGNSEKNTFALYLKVFKEVFYSIKNQGFNKQSIIPLSINGTIANGAHRVASSIIADKKIPCVNIEVTDHIYDYKFFYERNVPSRIMDAAACEFIEQCNNIFLAIIWPTAVKKDKEINEILKNIIYEKKISFNSNGAHNLLSQIYYGEEWIGSVENNFKGSQGKLIECFKNFNPVRFIAFQSNSIKEVQKNKEKIRTIFNVGKHSIHITDTKMEALRISRLVFNDNSVHFLNYAKPNKFISTHSKIEDFKIFMNKNNISNSEVLLDAGLVLSAYGLREARDTDFFISDDKAIKFEVDLINNHDEVLDYYQKEKMELIYDQNSYFYFNDLKFISLFNLHQMKLCRNEKKDQNDSKLMEALIEDNSFKNFHARFLQFIYYEKIKLRHSVMKLLKILGLYNFIKKMYYLRLKK